LITSINGDIRSTKDEIERLKEAVDREVRKPEPLSFGEEIRIMHQNGTLNEDSLTMVIQKHLGGSIYGDGNLYIRVPGVDNYNFAITSDFRGKIYNR
jgi:hypothetical protein